MYEHFDAETYTVKSVCENLINRRDSVKRDSIKQRDFVQRYSVSVRTFVCYLIGLGIDAETTRQDISRCRALNDLRVFLQISISWQCVLLLEWTGGTESAVRVIFVVSNSSAP
jgi:hypothetical protein